MEPILCSPTKCGQHSAYTLTIAAKNPEPCLPTFLAGDTLPIQLSGLYEHQTPVMNGYSPVSHATVVETVQSAVRYIFRHEKIAAPQVRVSQPIYARQGKGQLKPVVDHEVSIKPAYFLHMAFLVELPSVVDTLGGEKVHMCVGGVSSMDSTAFLPGMGQKVQLFAGFLVRGVRHTCVFKEGLLPNLWVKNTADLNGEVYKLLCEYDAVEQLCQLESMLRHRLSEQQVMHLLGRTLLYQQLPPSEQILYPAFLFTDFQVRSVAANYWHHERFGMGKDGTLTLWQLYNLLMAANMNSHPDLFLERAANASSFVAGLATALERRKKHWFLP